MTIMEGETLAVVGASGSGKTTLARALIGLVDVDKGEILVAGENVWKREKDFFRRIQMIAQNPSDSLSPQMNVLETVREPLDIQGIGQPVDRIDRVRLALDTVELPNNSTFLHSYPHHMSGGEAQRIAIARALVLEPMLLIADEPTSALDPSVQAKILRLLLDLQEKKGLALLFISHDLALARKVSDRMAVMFNGCIVESGETTTIMTSPQHSCTKDLLLHADTTLKHLKGRSRCLGGKGTGDSWGQPFK